MSPVANPQAELPPRLDDELLEPKQLDGISLFARLSRKPPFAKLPGSVVLRRYRSGEAIVRQGEAGSTAFYILKCQDVLDLRRSQLATAERQLAEPAGNPLARQSDAPRIAEIQREIAQYQDRVRQFEAAAAAGRPRMDQVATAHLLVDLTPTDRSGLWQRLKRAVARRPDSAEALPKFIPNDGPADISVATRQAPMHEGELFGEMSCMSRAPRSATIVADCDCYMLEMLRNILDSVRKDAAYKEQMDRIYRERALGGQLRRLSIFADLTDEQFAQLGHQVELITIEPGHVIWDEGDAADSLCVIRSGLVKVLKNVHYLLSAADIPKANWPAVCGELAAAATGATNVQATVWRLLPADAHPLIQQAAQAGSLKNVSVAAQTAVLVALNALIRDRRLLTACGKKKEELVALVDDDLDLLGLADFPDKVDEWSDLELREFNRLMLEQVAPTLPKRRLLAGQRRTLAYLGRGDYFGEAGVLRAAPRGATCVAYNHPDNGQAIASGAGITPARVELVRIGREQLLEICRLAPAVEQKLKAEAELRDRRTQELVERDLWDENRPITADPQFEELGLIQGQKLMLVDLDRCTRCGDCMRACVNTHEDGVSRLYLDGPRFGKYLVPNACRKCLDPVCMIGCPVGSIVRGSDGEIIIKNWCIGCQLCADQCPYGSIHMHGLGELQHAAPPVEPALVLDTETKQVEVRAVVCDLCSSLPSKQPACVYHCPHDAAMRIDARFEFPLA